MKREYLPIGSVVLLKNTKKRLMITGFYVKPNMSNVYYDYLGCIFPEGMVSEHENYIFNNEQIEKVFHKGLEDDEETDFKAKLCEIIDSIENESKDDKIISIPVDLYQQQNAKSNIIISVPLDEYNKRISKKICIPADLYNLAQGLVKETSNVISIPAEMYKEHINGTEVSTTISAPSDFYEEETGASKITVSNEDNKRESNNIISIPFEVYKNSMNKIVSVPYDEYAKIIKSRSVISINAKSYEEFLEQENKVINIPKNEEQKQISIPLNVYERLKNKEKEDIVSIPLDVYEKIINSEKDNKIISIPINEYEKLTKGTEKDGIISLPSDVYNEFLRKEKSEIDGNVGEIIEIPFDLYKRATIKYDYF